MAELVIAVTLEALYVRQMSKCGQLKDLSRKQFMSDWRAKGQAKAIRATCARAMER